MSTTQLTDGAATSHRSPAATTTHATRVRADEIAYGLVLGGIYLLLGTLWFTSAKEKLIDGGGTASPGIHKMFAGTILDSFPGTNAAWLILGICEAVAFLLILASAVSGEFLLHRRKPLLLTGLGMSMATFSMLAFGDAVAQQHDGVASLFTYFGLTAVLIILTLLMPPYRQRAWLGSLTGGGRNRA